MGSEVVDLVNKFSINLGKSEIILTSSCFIIDTVINKNENGTKELALKGIASRYFRTDIFTVLILLFYTHIHMFEILLV